MRRDLLLAKQILHSSHNFCKDRILKNELPANIKTIQSNLGIHSSCELAQANETDYLKQEMDQRVDEEGCMAQSQLLKCLNQVFDVYIGRLDMGIDSWGEGDNQSSKSKRDRSANKKMNYSHELVEHLFEQSTGVKPPDFNYLSHDQVMN